MNKMIVAAVVILISAGAFAQKQQKPWIEWSKKEAQKILDDSAWSQTQVETDTSEMFYTPTATTQTGTANNQGRGDQGATNQATNVTFRIRLFSARPIRQAYVRMLELEQAQPSEQAVAEKRRAWANLRADDRIIVAVSYQSPDRRYLGRVSQAFNSAVTAVLKNSTYLERKDGKRVFLSEYVPPSKDPFGARFIFPRTIDGQPFIAADSGAIRFHSEYENKFALDSAGNPEGTTSRGATRQTNGTIQSQSPFKIKLDMKFKIADLMYNGELEY